MRLESYFDFLSENDIRLKGTRIGIETILEDFFNGSDPEEYQDRIVYLPFSETRGK